MKKQILAVLFLLFCRAWSNPIALKTVILKSCVLKQGSSSCVSFDPVADIGSNTGSEIVGLQPGDGLNLTCITAKQSTWILRIPKNLTAVVGGIKLISVPSVSDNLIYQNILIPSVPGGLVGSVRCAVNNYASDGFREIFIDSSGTNKFKFLEPQDTLSYFIENPTENLVIPCASISGSKGLENINVMLYGMGRLKDPGCDSKPYMVPPGFGTCLPSSSSIIAQGQPMTFDSYDATRGVLTSNTANYSSRYVCGTTSDKQVLSGIFEPLDPRNQLQVSVSLEDDQLNCTILVDDPDKYPNALELVVSDCDSLIDCDLKRRPFLELGDLTDIASRASSTGESWGRRVAALIRRPTGAFLSVGLSDPSLPEQYFVQHFDYFFKGMDAKMYLASSSSIPASALTNIGADKNKKLVKCSALKFFVPVRITFKVDKDTGSSIFLAPTAPLGNERLRNGTLDVAFAELNLETFSFKAVQCLIDYLRYGRVLSKPLTLS